MWDVWECACGFMNSQVLFAGVEMGVFDALDRSPRSAAELAPSIGLSEDAARRLLTALCGLGFVHRDDEGRYLLPREASERLVSGKPGYVGDMFHHLRHALYPLWQHLPEALREERPQWPRAFPARPTPTESLFDEGEGLEQFLSGMAALTYPPAKEFARQAAAQLRAVDTIVDVGGASGAFLAALAEEHPHLRGTVFDLPPVQPFAEAAIRRRGLADRLRFHPGDFWEEPLPGGADAYALGFILHDWDTNGGTLLLEKVAQAIRPGGLLIVGEYLLHDDRTGPLWVARQDLNMLLAAHGRERTEREYIDWITPFGFEHTATYEAGQGRWFLVLRECAATAPRTRSVAARRQAQRRETPRSHAVPR